jgi:peptidyl-prolyl cis-trans isomerase D
MLEFIRQNAQSWGIKVLFGIIILVFVFWGVGSFRGNQKKVLATVNEREIGTKEFFRVYEQQLQQMRQQQGDVSYEQLKQMDFKQQVFQRMVDSMLLLDQARELGMFATSAEIRGAVMNMEVFKGENQSFDSARYEALLRANQMTPAQFEADVQTDLVRQKLQSYVLSPVQVADAEARELFEYVQEKAVMDYIPFARAEFMDQARVEDQEIKSFYDDNQEQFREPARMAMEYLLLTPENLARYQKVADEEIAAYYERNKEAYTRPEQVKARHILVRLEEEAPAEMEKEARGKIDRALERLEQGESFAEVARDVSEGPSSAQGGDLGWFGRGAMVPDFEDKAFSLQPGEVSSVVRTRFGLHVIKVEDKREAGIRPLEEVRSRIKSQIAEDKAADRLEDMLDQALELLLARGDLTTVAEELDVELQETGLFSKAQGPEGLDMESEDLETLFAMQKDMVTDTPILLDNGYLLARKTKAVESRIRPLDGVRARIVQTLKQDKAMRLAREAARDELKDLLQDRGNGNSTSSGEIQTSEPFNRRGFVPGLGSNPELASDLFAAEKGQWLDQAYQVGNAYVLARLSERVPAEQEQWEEQKSMWMSSMNRTRAQAFLQAYLQGLRDKAEIEIVTPEILAYE